MALPRGRAPILDGTSTGTTAQSMAVNQCCRSAEPLHAVSVLSAKTSCPAQLSEYIHLNF